MADPKKTVRPEAIARANRLRALPLLRALDAVGAYAKLDVSYEPSVNRDASRYHIAVNGREFELLIRREKWFDTRAQKGGGGAIDLMMHVFGEPFNKALQRLSKAVP